MSTAVQKKDPFGALRHPEFRNYIISRFFFILVINMQATLISWKVYEMTKSTVSIGLIGLVEFVPALCMAFYSGHVIDKSDKRALLLRSIVGNALLTGILCFFTTDMVVAEISQGWLLLIIYSVVFGTGILRSFSGPTSFALVSHLVPKHTLSNATIWHSGSWQVGAVTGPALAGLLYATAGITYTFYVMLLLMIIAITGVFFIKPKPFTGQRREEKFIESIRQGFRFVWRTKEVLGALSLDLFAVLFGGATALLPVFADQILHVGPEGLGMLRSAPALGAVVVLVLLTFRPLKHNQGRLMLLCVAGFGICIIVFGLSEIFWLSMIALFVSGILDGVSVIVRSTILQLRTPDEMRGRVAALNSIFIMSSNELGSAESGFAAKLLGTVPSVLFGGGMTLAVVVYTWLKAPTLRKLQY